MNTSEQINELSAALSVAQGGLKDAAKDREGYGYKYADLASILKIARPILAQHGLAVVQEAGTDDNGMISVVTRVMHSSGQWLECAPLKMPVEPKKGLSQAQAAGSVVTYARRYALAALLGITQDDDDGAGAAHEPVATLSGDQQASIHDLAEANGVDVARICAAYKAATLADIPASRYAQIVARIKQSQAKQ